MSRHTSTGKGLDKPHKHVPAVPGQGSAWKNAKSIASSEKTPKGPKSKGGVAPSYFGNSRACNTD